MKIIKLSNHAEIRCNQRGVKQADIDLAILYGSETPKGYLITERDFQSVEREMKRELKRLERLKGKLFATQGDTITTVFHTSERQRKMLEVYG